MVTGIIHLSNGAERHQRQQKHHDNLCGANVEHKVAFMDARQLTPAGPSLKGAKLYAGLLNANS